MPERKRFFSLKPSLIASLWCVFKFCSVKCSIWMHVSVKSMKTPGTVDKVNWLTHHVQCTLTLSIVQYVLLLCVYLTDAIAYSFFQNIVYLVHWGRSSLDNAQKLNNFLMWQRPSDYAEISYIWGQVYHILRIQPQ